MLPLATLVVGLLVAGRAPSRHGARRAPVAAAPLARMQLDFGKSAGVLVGEALEIEIDVGEDEDGPPELVWAAATVESVDSDSGEFDVFVTEFAQLPPDDPEYEEAYSEGPCVAPHVTADPAWPEHGRGLSMGVA
jgi:hypothetical protein